MSEKNPETPDRVDPQAFRELIRTLSGEDIGRCIQCGKCTAGCPVAEDVSPTPNQVMQLVRMNALDEALQAKSIWYCTACHTCASRCPQDIDIAEVMNALRRLVLERDLPPAERDVAVVNDVFMRSLRSHGRVFELGVVMNKNLRTGKFLKDAGLGPAMFQKGKIGIRPHNIQNRGRVRSILSRARRFGVGEDEKP